MRFAHPRQGEGESNGLWTKVAVAADLYIRRLQITMDDAAVVRGASAAAI